MSLSPLPNLPTQASTTLGTITGAVDGTNGTFVVGLLSPSFEVYRNGVLMTEGPDYSRAGQIVTFNIGQIPVVDDVIAAEVFNNPY